MSTAPRPPSPKDDKPFVDRRAPNDLRGPARWLLLLRSIFSRPIRIRRVDGKLHIVLIERRRPRPSPLESQRGEMRRRMRGHALKHPPEAMRHLMYVHDELGRSGWAGLEALPLRVIAKAVAQAELLCTPDPRSQMPQIVDRLKLIRVAVEERQRKAAEAALAAGDSSAASFDADGPDSDFMPGYNVEISESTHEDFEEMERSWVGTVPPEVALAQEKRRLELEKIG